MRAAAECRAAVFHACILTRGLQTLNSTIVCRAVGSPAQAVAESDPYARRRKEGILPYIFGYGSLIEQASRLRSTPSALYVLPARARGYARGWWARTGAIGFSTTFVGAIPEKSSSMNGVIYAVNKEELDDTDKAGKRLYERGHRQPP